MAELSKETEQKIQQLQLLEQNMQAMLIQKQQFQSQLLEISSALEELSSTSNAYKIVGNIMVSSDKDSLKKDLDSRKEVLALRIKTIEKQENQLKDKAKTIQDDVMSKMKK